MNSVYPFDTRKVNGDKPFSIGLHVLHAVAAAGKTVNSVALELVLRAQGYRVLYLPYMEPRGMMLVPGSAAAASQDAAQEAGSESGQSGSDYIRSLPPEYYFEGTHAEFLSMAMREVANQEGRRDLNPVLIIDSLTHNVQSLPETVAALKEYGGSTFSGGLDTATVQGILHHNLRAMSAGVVLIGTINAELLPTVKLIEGSCEGVMQCSQVGIIEHKSRSTARKWQSMSVQSGVAGALAKLGYDTADLRFATGDGTSFSDSSV